MAVLGLSGLLHDCAYAIVSDDGEIKVHNELERDLRLKEIPGNSLLYYLQDTSSEKYDNTITAIATYYHPLNIEVFEKLNRLIRNWDENLAASVIRIQGSYQISTKDEGSYVRSRLKNLLLKKPNIGIFGHHECHAAEVFYRTPLDNAIIISIDGGGFDFYSNKIVETHTTAWQGKYNALDGASISKIIIDTNNSLGSIYNVITKSLGFTTGYPNGSQAGSTMGMAAYGDSSIYRSLLDDELLWQNTSASNPKRLDVIQRRELLAKDIKNLFKIDPDIQIKFDIAASLQYHFTKRLTRFVSDLLSYKQYSAIYFTGGCSLNCAAIGSIVSQLSEYLGSFKNIFCSNIPYDAGLSLGAAFLMLGKAKNKVIVHNTQNMSPYLGRKYSGHEVASITNHPSVISSDLDYENICNSLSDGNIGAIYNGSSESGRRALGNRSIIADPRIKNIRDILNQKVKHRPLWRPFAPSILEEEACNWFRYPVNSEYMSFAIPFIEDKKSLVPAVVHQDGTGRLQTVPKSNLFFRKLLEHWFSKTGIPMLINTSFNDSEPIVETPSQALITFMLTKIDFLILPDINKVLIRRD